MTVDVRKYINLVARRTTGNGFICLFMYEYWVRFDETDKGTFRLKVMAANVPKTLSDGTRTKYRYGSVGLQTPQLAPFIGKKVLIRIFDEGKKKALR